MREARVPISTTPMRSIHQRTIAAIIVTQRLLEVEVMFPHLWASHDWKRIASAVRITQEFVDKACSMLTPAGVDALNKITAALDYDVAAHAWVKPS